MGRTHRESSMSKLDNDAKRVANIYIRDYSAKYSRTNELHDSLVGDSIKEVYNNVAVG